MATFSAIIPTLRVTDRGNSLVLWSAMGFSTIWEDRPAGEPGFAEVGRDTVAVFLSEHAGDGPEAISLYLLVDDAAALHATLVEDGITPNSEPTPTPWGNTDLDLTDRDGNHLRIGSPTAAYSEPASAEEQDVPIHEHASSIDSPIPSS
jgi:hypothetical protein